MQAEHYYLLALVQLKLFGVLPIKMLSHNLWWERVSAEFMEIGNKIASRYSQNF